MKVLFDISTLGLGYYYPRARTGIFRVVENLVYCLKESNQCDLLFCTSGSSRNLYMALDYLKSNPALQEVSVPYINWKYKRVVFNLQQQLSTQIEKKSAIEKLPLKIMRKMVNYIDDSTEKLYYATDLENIAKTDIYHSPLQPIPEHILKEKHIKKFLSVMDLIPILYPEFFKFREDNSLKDAISGLDSDSWVLCISQSTKNDLCNYSKLIDPSKVMVTYLAASALFYPCSDTQKQDFIRCKYGIPNAPYILSLSTLEPRKNIDHIIRCFVNLVQQEKIQDLYLVLVGAKGWNYDHILAEISSNSHLKERIIITGYVADEDLAALYSGAIAFVYPSFYEGFGLPPLEAMQCGIPVITSNTSSLPEVVGDAGIMLDPKDTDGLCQSLLDLYNKPSLRQSMSQKSLEQSKKFSWEKCTQETIAAYKMALSS
jgi:glycosyltransferase involved in cell wall biosynthesis